MDINQVRISPDNTYHIYKDKPLYEKRYTKVMSFHHPGIAAVQDGETAYHIDLEGKPVYARRFLKTFGFYDNIAAVQDTTGYYHIDVSGNEIYPERYSWVGNFQECMCVVRDAHNKYFHITKDGTPAYKDRYNYVGDYKYGIASIYRSDGFSTHIDKSGNYIHGKWYLECGNFHKGYAVARDIDGYFYIDISGQPLYNERYEWAEPFYNGQALVSDHDGRLYTIDESGTISLDIINDSASKVHQRSRNDLMNMLVGYWKTQILYSIVKYDILQTIKDGSNDLFNLKKDCGISEESLDMILRVALLWGLVRKTSGKYYLTYKGELLTENGSDSLKYATIMWGEEHYFAMSKLAEALNDNQAHFKDLYGHEFFDYISLNKDKSLVYNKAMAEYSIDYDSIIDLYNFSRTKVLMDIGGSHGQLLSKIFAKYAEIEQGIIFDLSVVIIEAKQALRESPYYHKIKFVPGNFFTPLSGPQADTIILSRVLHDWNDEEAIKILKNISGSLMENGKLLIFEMVVPDNPKIDMGTTLNFNLLVMVGGKERTQDEFEYILKESGYKICDVRKGNSIISVIIAERERQQ